MNITDLKKSWSGLQEETKAYKKLCVGLIAANIILGCFLFTKETTVVMQPWTLTQTAQLENKAASRSYKEAWALAIAEMLGNLTPNNVDFVVDRLRPLLDPSIYNEVVRNANEQTLSLKRSPNRSCRAVWSMNRPPTSALSGATPSSPEPPAR